MVKKLNILSLSVKGLSKNKREILSHIDLQENAQHICIKETQIDSDISSICTVSGNKPIYKLINQKHGRAIYASRDYMNIRITNMYKPLSDTLSNNLQIIYQRKSVYIGDFNSHHPQWVYNDENKSGSILSD
ncbi:hypothetical protein RF11_04700 [Thelohanellus kitauei]|uniref:Endonuclease/exonuclease/phosphatase domain-containing protein n=1 Tax=Thelohanellus kitauei TaxID=669202 RepID=A0A0C2JV69_THEKT|nr:hypothetical protein RF11_04700 [Thelohanellus kitauei]